MTSDHWPVGSSQSVTSLCKSQNLLLKEYKNCKNGIASSKEGRVEFSQLQSCSNGRRPSVWTKKQKKN